MRTVKQALLDEIHYPISDGFVSNKLLSRGLSEYEEISYEIIQSPMFRGAVADCLFSLIEAPNVSESGVSFSMSDKELILKKVNAIYSSLGEPEVALQSVPKVTILNL